MAALRRGVDGNILLDHGITASIPKIVRVRIKDKGVLVSTSSLPHVSVDAEIAIEELILRARNNIFEEELFHEIHREARTLASQGVHIVDNVIHIPSANDREVLLDIVPFSDEPPQPSTSTGAKEHMAESIALSLRILLSYAHRQNLRRRSQLPPPLTERKPPRLIYAILRPILTYLQHQSALTALRGFLGTIVQPLRAAGLTCEFGVDTLTSLNLSAMTDISLQSGKSAVDALVETLTRRLASSATVTMPAATKVHVDVRTHLYPPTFGTEYSVTATPSHSSSDPSTTPFASQSDFQEYMLHLLTLDTVAAISAFPSSSTNGDDTNSEAEPWLVTDAHSGELTKSFGKLGRSKRMVVSVLQEKIEVKWGWMNGKPEQGRYVWDRAGAESDKKGGRKTLREVVDEVGKYKGKKSKGSA